MAMATAIALFDIELGAVDYSCDGFRDIGSFAKTRANTGAKANREISIVVLRR
jgi:hypothetical protein